MEKLWFLLYRKERVTMSNTIYQGFLKEWNRIGAGKPENKITQKVKNLLYAGIITEGAFCQVSYEKEELVLNFKLDSNTTFSLSSVEAKELLKSVKDDNFTKMNSEDKNDCMVENQNDLKSNFERIEDTVMPICETINVEEGTSYRNLILLWDGKANDVRVTMADEKVFLPKDAPKSNKIIIPVNNVQAGVKIHVSLYGDVKNFHYKWDTGLES